MLSNCVSSKPSSPSPCQNQHSLKRLHSGRKAHANELPVRYANTITVVVYNQKRKQGRPAPQMTAFTTSVCKGQAPWEIFGVWHVDCPAPGACVACTGFLPPPDETATCIAAKLLLAGMLVRAVQPAPCRCRALAGWSRLIVACK
jgi:hypothetical protein